MAVSNRTKRRILLLMLLLTFSVAPVLYLVARNGVLLENITPNYQIQGFVEKRRWVFVSKKFKHIGERTKQWTEQLGKQPVIPTIIHQQWKTKDVPVQLRRFPEDCKLQYSDWGYHLWTEVDSRQLVAKFFPHFLDVFDSFPKPSYREFFVRYMYMYLFGGIFVQVDFECLRPMGRFFKENPQSVYFGQLEPHNESFNYSIPNAWIASPPHHPFWLLTIMESIRRSEEALSKFWPQDAEYVSGSKLLHWAIQEYDKFDIVGKITLLPSELIYPFSYQTATKHEADICFIDSKLFDAEKCRAMVGRNESYFLPHFAAID